MPLHIDTYKQIIMPIILKHLPYAKVILYGSRARKEAREGSDIDIALDGGKEIEENKISTIKRELEESNLPIAFDIVDFHAISKEIQKEILKEGIIWKK